MTLVLCVTSYQNRTHENLTITIGHEDCNIGRAPDNDFVLPDADRIVSHQHASVHFENGHYYLSDNSTNGTFINHAPEPVGRGHSVRLYDGDILSIGEYECRISLSQEDVGIPRPEAGLVAEPPGKLWGAVENQPEISPPYAIPESLMHGEKPGPENLFDDFDFSSLAVSAAEKPAAAAEHGAADQQFFQPPQAIPENWDIQAEEKTGLEESVPFPSSSEPISEPIEARLQPSQTQQEKKTPAAKPDAPINATAGNQAVAAFLQGAGLESSTPSPDEINEFMASAGRLLRVMSEGYKQILETRTSLKSEFRLGVTTIRPAQNNPFKFSIDANGALAKLLFPTEKGYLPPIESVQEAIDDIQAHQMATLSGLRVALSTLVHRFDPESVEKEFQSVSTIDGLLPFIRKAKYWDLFKHRYRIAEADAENDFLHLLGDEFASAYEQQIAELKRAKK
ncbi:hypothetical protein MNBD_GAMMA20-1032 [hydrothermal vent metagenome]|uniref:FHA domain-containing protein n=1 Tax=hydrothermal vent metagenome TaxID=652676 RepID=A0A3B1A746_9ZZZZ